MHSFLLSLALLAAGPTAPVAPEPPRFELPALPPLIAGTPPGEAVAPRADANTAGSNASGGQLPHRNEPAPTPAATPAPKAAAKAQPQLPDSTVLPPSLTPTALRDELRAASQRRQDELAAVARERARLEKLSTEIAAARAALETETARLDDKVKKTEAAKGAAAQPGAAEVHPGAKPPGEGLARTLKGMKPDQAAALVSRLERRLAVNLLRQMRPADAGGVLEKMKPETAAELFSLMASDDAGGSR